MMDDKFDIQVYLTRGVENIVSGALRTTLRDTSLRQALASLLFAALREGELLTDDHASGCVLFEKRATVEALL